MQTNLLWQKADGWLPGGRGRYRGRGRDHRGVQGDFGGDGYVIILIVMMVSQVYKCVKTCQIVYFKCVYFLVCQFYIYKAVFKILNNDIRNMAE